ncbi:hypothetical protein CupriaWKF_24595 [Cupriavidus sp. WKF15]|uniref:hypothetical protein n=1 Tax=Cupriavidus sp. WKF15 TaxID=3032282 RepID=UPI0023E172C0|nr:hypothetical protein [Cupriavidus sp. WKF15]WER47989.1 hypothetical protein CupriaWKF_24595 [Cupriavidus sp. WKF15]
MRKASTTHIRFALAFAMLTALALPAWAQSPHFVGKVSATLQEDGDLQVCFKEAGLGNNLNINYEATADGTATYVCTNNGGQCPDASNKITTNGPVSKTGTFNSGQNGSISQCLVVSPPSAGSFTCPGGQTLTLSQVSYSDIVITDTSNGVSKDATPSTISATVFRCPGPKH